MTPSYYWSSTEYTNVYSWHISTNKGGRTNYNKNANTGVRSFSYLENKFNPKDASSAPKIGDVMYSDLTYGSADDYDGSKTAVGIVTWGSEDGRSAKIVNLKELTFSSTDTTNNFNPDNPYSSTQFLSAIQEAVSESASKARDGDTISQYISVLNQYDSLIKDAGYKGVNLLQEQNLQVTFNEGRSSLLQVAGKNLSSQTLGLVTLEWNSKEDIEKSIEELTKAINTIRSYSSELGNNYNIITTRQDFTENLINVLTEGADKLTLADMNEESANMLALQTRQQLAINSLSLASQASQSILKLF